MNISNLFFEAVKSHPNKPAVIDDTGSITFSKLEEEVRKTAKYFYSKGIRKNDRVLVFVPMSLDLYRIVLAIFSMGATAVFIDEWSDKKRLRQSCKLAQCKGLVASKKIRFISLLYSETRAIPIKLSDRKINSESQITEEMYPDDSALITFTTGSSGKPKAADRTHEFLATQFEILRKEIDPQPNEVDLVNLPIMLFINLAAGCTSVIPQYNSRKPLNTNWNLILEQITKNNISRITGSPYFVSGLARFLIENSKENNIIAKIFTGGGPVFSDETIIILNAFPKSKINIVYGATEVEPISLISGNKLIQLQESDNKGLPVGRPHESIDLRIIRLNTSTDKEFSENEFDKLCTDENEIGEIVVSGKPVLNRYFKSDSTLRSQKLKSGRTTWHCTGDSGYLKNGNLFLTGRCTEVIVHKGQVYSLFMIENALRQNSKIKCGTLIQSNGKNILCLELKEKTKIIKDSFDFPVDEIKILKLIPKDPRHHTKIDYDLLRKLI